MSSHEEDHKVIIENQQKIINQNKNEVLITQLQEKVRELTKSQDVKTAWQQRMVGIMFSLLVAIGGWVVNLNSTIATLIAGHDKLEKIVVNHINDPKLHHNIKETIGALEKQVVVLLDRVNEIGDDLDSHESHPKLHENILVEVEILKEKIVSIN